MPDIAAGLDLTRGTVLIRTSPDRAYAEITEVVDISRRALDDVRSVAGGYREMSLPEEIVLARSMLAAADVTARVDVSGIDRLPPEVGTVLGIVVREGVTNVLRHSRATLCRISIRRAGTASSSRSSTTRPSRPTFRTAARGWTAWPPGWPPWTAG